MRRIETLLTLILATSAVVIAAALARREFVNTTSTSAVSVATLRSDAPSQVEDWERIALAGLRFGSSAAPVMILEFSDLECPFCRRFHSTLQAVRARFGAKVAYVFVHYPLPMHRLARHAARGLECADLQGRSEAYLDVVFGKQDSLGLKPWSSYAVDAGVPDTGRYRRCLEDATPLPRIETGLAEGAKLDISGTPTVIVNGWRFPNPPDDSLLSAVILRLLEGRDPFDDGAR